MRTHCVASGPACFSTARGGRAGMNLAPCIAQAQQLVAQCQSKNTRAMFVITGSTRRDSKLAHSICSSSSNLNSKPMPYSLGG